MRAYVAVVIAAAAIAGCGERTEERAADRPGARPDARVGPAEPAPSLRPPPCPPDLGNCERASGTIAYVERVDPDGDGDAHFVLLSGASVSAPGLTIVDVSRDLRPRPLPGPGAHLAAAGPVYPGSRGQLQIEAIAVRVAGH